MKKKKRIKIMTAVILMLVLTVSMLLYLDRSNLKTKLKSQNATSNSPSLTPIFVQNKPIDEPDKDMLSPTDTSSTRLIGIFNVIYGDPGNGGKPRYHYSVTDSQEKTFILDFTGNTRFIGGTKPSDYDRKNVKIEGKKISSSGILEVLSIELE